MNHFKQALARLNKAIAKEELVLRELETGPINPGQGGSPTETGCPCCTSGRCYNCLVKAIQKVETGGEPEVGGVRGCNARGDGGASRGPHQIGRAYIIDACQACPDFCSAYGGAQGVIDRIFRDCPDPNRPNETAEACCATKVAIGEVLIGCYNKKYGENPSFSCRCKNKDSTGKECCSCEEIAKRHQGGLRGPCNDTPVRREYWRKVKEKMRETCPDCARCGSTPGGDVDLDVQIKDGIRI